MKKLTKVQKEILTTLRDNPQARIIIGYFDSQPRLYIGKELVKPIVTESFYFMKPWLEEGYDGWSQQSFYTFITGAKISDAWRAQEVERLKAEERLRGAERAKAEDEAYQALVSRLKEVMAAIERGEVDNREVEYGRWARFEYGGKWYNLSEER